MNVFSKPDGDVCNEQVALSRVSAGYGHAFLHSDEYRQRFKGGVPPMLAPASIFVWRGEA